MKQADRGALAYLITEYLQRQLTAEEQTMLDSLLSQAKGSDLEMIDRSKIRKIVSPSKYCGEPAQAGESNGEESLETRVKRIRLKRMATEISPKVNRIKKAVAGILR